MTKWDFRTTDVYFVTRTAFETEDTGLMKTQSISLDIS